MVQELMGIDDLIVAGSKDAMEMIQADDSVLKATIIYPSTQAADGIRLARLIVQQKGMSDLVQVEVPRRIVLNAPVVNADNVYVRSGAGDDGRGQPRRHRLHPCRHAPLGPGPRQRPADDGTHQVTASCDPAGDTIETASLFEVLPVSVHRPAFVTSLPTPGQISLDPGALLATGAIALGAIMLIAFPFELFNSAMEENYDEIRGWFGLGPRGVPEVKTRSGTLGFLGLTAVTTVATGFLSPDFGFNRTSVVLFIGICVALLVMAVLFSLPADIGIRRQFGEWGKLNFLPGTLIVSVVMVALSRVMDFQPGYFYGAIAGLVAITPAAGFAGSMGAIALGAIAGVVCLWAVVTLKPMLRYDDALDTGRGFSARQAAAMLRDPGATDG